MSRKSWSCWPPTAERLTLCLLADDIVQLRDSTGALAAPGGETGTLEQLRLRIRMKSRCCCTLQAVCRHACHELPPSTWPARRPRARRPRSSSSRTPHGPSGLSLITRNCAIDTQGEGRLRSGGTGKERRRVREASPLKSFERPKGTERARRGEGLQGNELTGCNEEKSL